MRLGNLKHIPGVPVHAPSVVDFNNQNLTAFSRRQDWYTNRLCLTQTFMLSTPFYELENYENPDSSPYNNGYRAQISNTTHFPMNLTVQVSIPSIAFDWRPGLEKYKEIYPESDITANTPLRLKQIGSIREIYRLADPELGEEIAQRRDFKRWDTQDSSLMRVAFTDVDWDKCDDKYLKEFFKTTNVNVDESGDVTIKIGTPMTPYILMNTFLQDNANRFLNKTTLDTIGSSSTFIQLENPDKAMELLAGLFPNLPKLQAIVTDSLMNSCSLSEDRTELVLHTNTIADIVKELQVEFKDTVFDKLKTQLETLGSNFTALIAHHGDHTSNSRLQNAAASISILLNKLAKGASFYRARFLHEYSLLCESPDKLYNDEYTRMVQGLFKLIELSNYIGSVGYSYNSLIGSFHGTNITIQQAENSYKCSISRYTLSKNRNPEIEEQLQGLKTELNNLVTDFDNAEIVIRTYRGYIFAIAYMLQRLVHTQIELINSYMIANYGRDLNLPEEKPGNEQA